MKNFFFLSLTLSVTALLSACGDELLANPRRRADERLGHLVRSGVLTVTTVSNVTTVSSTSTVTVSATK